MKTHPLLVGIILAFTLHFASAEEAGKNRDATAVKDLPTATPLFKNSIVSTEFDFITSEDPSAFCTSPTLADSLFSSKPAVRMSS